MARGARWQATWTSQRAEVRWRKEKDAGNVGENAGRREEDILQAGMISDGWECEGE
jgi:hypothetical protein